MYARPTIKFYLVYIACRKRKNHFSSFPLNFQSLTTIKNMVKVTVCGAAGGIGQPLSLLLKQSELITHLSLFDIVNTPGVAADLR